MTGEAWLHAALGSLAQAQQRANSSPDALLQRLKSPGRTDVVGLSLSASAWLIAEALRTGVTKQALVVTAGSKDAAACAKDLETFLGPAAVVLRLPASDTSPFLAVASDRRAAMDRAAVLATLARGAPWDALVLPAPALCRRLPPPEIAATRYVEVRRGEMLHRADLLTALDAAGYVRCPLVEDPGTFAVRGALVDVFSPREDFPVRIDFDDEEVASLKFFDPETQRSLPEDRDGPCLSVALTPAREHTLRGAAQEETRRRVRELFDAFNVPTTQAAAQLETLLEGGFQAGSDAFLPAFYTKLAGLDAYLAKEKVSTWVLDGVRALARVQDHLAQAQTDHEARCAAGDPTFNFGAYFLGEQEVKSLLNGQGHLCVTHPAAFDAPATPEVTGFPEGDAENAETNDVLGALAAPVPPLLDLGEVSLGPLREALLRERAHRGAREPLQAFRELAGRWLDQGLRVEVTARTLAQRQRLENLLRRQGLGVNGQNDAVSPDMILEDRDLDEVQGAQRERLDKDARAMRARPPSALSFSAGELSAGFVLASGWIAFVSESDLFGSRKARTGATKAPGEAQARRRAIVEDLRELAVGDYVVHVEHGIGRYLGLERKALELGSTASDGRSMPARASLALEVLVLEFAGGDRLFLPVTRLAQIEKYSAREGHAPRLDKLGGQSFSKTKRKAKESVQRIADELLELYAKRAAQRREPLKPADDLFAEFEATFPYEETPDQTRAIDDVLSDLVDERPMDRLVCGDVGFGKTEVAVRASFRVASAGRQVAVLCPTTVLAQQHYLSFKGRMEGFPVNVRMLSRFTSKEEAAETLAGLKSGHVDIVIGTHRLISKDVHFKQLGLMVVDEEQRFGVAHKERLKKLRSEVDVLTLTATPIPRTMQLAVGGLRDLSLITTAPVDRRAVRTHLCRWDDHLVASAIEREVARGGQVFFVQNRISRLYERANQLQALLPKVRFVVGHGQLKEGELERVMLDFVDGKYDVLCATTIIESGLDIPRANTIFVDGANAFGMAQLYQIRGRVGRSKERAFCYLITPPPSTLSDEARARLAALERFTELGSGFHISSLDMELRGAGDILGTDQSGTIANVGFDLFLRMLEEAMAELRGEPLAPSIDPELSFDLDFGLPEDYVDDTGLRLSFYKRLSQALRDADIDTLAGELEDRFGPPPREALALIEVMRIKWRLRELLILGIEATASRVTLHLHPDTRLDPRKLMPRLQSDPERWRLTPDMRLTRRFMQPQRNALEAAHTLLDTLATLTHDLPLSA